MQDGQEKVIAYWSCQLQKPERNYSTVEREALTVVSGVKEFYPYLYGFQFKLLTHHNPSTSLKGLKYTGDILPVGCYTSNNSTSLLSIRAGQVTPMPTHSPEYPQSQKTCSQLQWMKPS